MNSPAPLPSSEPSLLPGVNVLLEGGTGTGKTHSLGTLIDTGLECFYCGLESGMESLLGYWTDRGKPIPSNLKWHQIVPSDGGIEDLIAGAKQVGDLVQDALYKVVDFDRGKNNKFERVLRLLANFEDQRTGEKFGSVHTWGPDRAIIIDGLTGLGLLSMYMVIGKKPIKSQTDWGLAQDQIEKLLRMLCDGCKCHFVLLAHQEREVDQVSGGVKVTVSTLGRALPPKIPPMFSDVIMTIRNGSTWTWSTANIQADLKTRNLAVADNLLPSFAPIIDRWKSRGGRFSKEVKK